MGEHARRMVHAGAVGTALGGVLLAGRGGVGKSTTALSCLLSGLLYAGDDYVLLDTEMEPIAHSLYCSAKLHVDQLRRFPQLSPAVSPHQLSEEKVLLLLYPRFEEQIETSLSIQAIVLPQIVGLGRTRLRSVSATISLMALAPSTIFQLQGSSQATFQHIRRLVEQVPSYVLELGADVGNIPRVIVDLLSSLQVSQSRRDDARPEG
jgi:hypothetical protein